MGILTNNAMIGGRRKAPMQGSFMQPPMQSPIMQSPQMNQGGLPGGMTFQQILQQGGMMQGLAPEGMPAPSNNQATSCFPSMGSGSNTATSCFPSMNTQPLQPNPNMQQGGSWMQKLKGSMFR